MDRSVILASLNQDIVMYKKLKPTLLHFIHNALNFEEDLYSQVLSFVEDINNIQTMEQTEKQAKLLYYCLQLYLLKIDDVLELKKKLNISNEEFGNQTEQLLQATKDTKNKLTETTKKVSSKFANVTKETYQEVMPKVTKTINEDVIPKVNKTINEEVIPKVSKAIDEGKPIAKRYVKKLKDKMKEWDQ